jgi:hypothetical protein
MRSIQPMTPPPRSSCQDRQAAYSVRHQQRNRRHSAPGICLLFLTVLLNGCASTRVEYFVDPPYPAHDPKSQVEWLSTEPSRVHIELARITVGSANLGEDTLRQKIIDRARSLGADAVVAEGAALVNSLPNPPFYERSLFGPMGAAFGLYGYGWYTPYTSNPFLLTQGATDIPRTDRYLSGLAIRYGQDHDTDQSP